MKHVTVEGDSQTDIPVIMAAVIVATYACECERTFQPSNRGVRVTDLGGRWDLSKCDIVQTGIHFVCARVQACSQCC